MSNKFGLYRTRNDAPTLVDELMHVPKKDTRENTPTHELVNPHYTQQADLLFLPNDKGYRYALVVVDVGSRLCDAVPLSDKTQEAVIKGFETIYSRKKPYLTMPKAIMKTDAGSEFKGKVWDYFSKHKVMIHTAKTARHRQIAVVESYNGIIARALFYAMHTMELKTKKTNGQWIRNLPQVIRIINKHMAQKVKGIRAGNKTAPYEKDPRCEGNSCKMLSIGDRVRVISEQPTDSTGVKLGGKHRKTDLRYEVPIRTIKDIVLSPDQPPLYKISGVRHVNYTKAQLQQVK